MHCLMWIAMKTALLLSATSGPDLDVIARAQKAAGVELSSDATLARGAACLAKFARKGQTLTAGLVRFCAEATGAYEAVLVPLVGESSASQNLLEALTRFFRSEARDRALTHYGAANVRDSSSQTLAVLASLRRGSFELASGADLCKQRRVTFTGEVTRGHAGMRAFLTLPNGSVSALPLQQQGRAYRGEAAFDAGNGRYQIEVLADSSEGPHVVANRALFVCAKPPEAPPASAFGAPDGGANKDTRMLELMNAERRRANLPPLAIDAPVTAVAHAHAADMQKKGYFAHTAKDGATLGDRLRRAGIAFQRATENLSSAPSAEDAHQSLMGSPGHRKNILDPEVTHVGIGVVPQPLSNGQPNFIFVVNFVSFPAAADAGSFRQALLTTLNQERAKAGLRPLVKNGALDALADKHSKDMAARDALAYVPNEEGFFDAVQAKAGAHRLDADLFVTTDPAVLRKSQNVRQEASAIGFGVALVSSKRFGEQVFFVTVIYVRE